MEKLSRHWPIIEPGEKEHAIVLGILFDTIQALRDQTAECARLKKQLSELRTELSEASKAAAEIGERILNLIPDKVREAKREMREAVRLQFGLEGEELDKLMAIPLDTPALGNSGSAGLEEPAKKLCKFCAEGIPLRRYFDGRMMHSDGLSAWSPCESAPRQEEAGKEGE